MLSKFSKREQILVASTVTIAVATLAYVLIIDPIIGAYSTVERRIEAKKKKLQKDYRVLRKERVIKTDFNKYAFLIKPLASDEEEIASMLRIIEVVGRKNSIRITNIRPRPVKDKLYYKEFVFEVVAEAEIDKLVKFIYELQSSDNLLRIVKLSISAGSTRRRVKGLRAILEISKPGIPAI